MFAAVFMVAFAVLGSMVAQRYISQLGSPTGRFLWFDVSTGKQLSSIERLSALTAFTVVGLLLGLLVSSLVYAELQRLQRAIAKMSAQDKIAVVAGLLVGLLLTVLICISIFQQLSLLPRLAVAIIFCYLGVTAALSMKEQVKLYFPSTTPSGKQAVTSFLRPKILDTNVIIDGRIADICKAGFVEGPIYIPRFVLDELQQIADSSDPLKRARGRRGLDILNAMQQEMSLQIQTYDLGNGNGSYPEEVDGKLVELAKDLNGALVTNDYNLNKVAGLHGVNVLNVNELANALKPVVLPGEEMSILVIKDGKESSQGVGYLDDGTMVVVEGARRYIGNTVDVIVTSVLQTAAGKMIFANLRNDLEEEDTSVDESSRYYPGSRPRRKIR
jgi:uncharacterized protein YacL